jgi:hypothetical protein
LKKKSKIFWWDDDVCFVLDQDNNYFVNSKKSQVTDWIVEQFYLHANMQAVLEMKIWIYWSESNSRIYFYIFLNKNWKIYWSEQSFTGLGLTQAGEKRWGGRSLSLAGKDSVILFGYTFSTKVS